MLQLLLIDTGVLRRGDWFVSGLMWGSVRSILDEQAVEALDEAGEQGCDCSLVGCLLDTAVYSSKLEAG